MEASVTLGHAANRDHRDKFSIPSLRSHTGYIKPSEDSLLYVKTSHQNPRLLRLEGQEETKSTDTPQTLPIKKR